MPPEEDDPPRQSNVNRTLRQISDLRETFLAAHYDPALSKDRARFGDDMAWLRDYIAKREKRWEWTAKLMGGFALAALTWAVTVFGPLLGRLLLGAPHP
jgi:hypothetical protein